MSVNQVADQHGDRSAARSAIPVRAIDLPAACLTGCHITASRLMVTTLAQRQLFGFLDVGGEKNHNRDYDWRSLVIRDENGYRLPSGSSALRHSHRIESPRCSYSLLFASQEAAIWVSYFPVCCASLWPALITRSRAIDGRFELNL